MVNVESNNPNLTVFGQPFRVIVKVFRNISPEYSESLMRSQIVEIWLSKADTVSTSACELRSLEVVSDGGLSQDEWQAYQNLKSN